MKINKGPHEGAPYLFGGIIFFIVIFIGILNTILSEHLSKAIESEKLVFSITVMNIKLTILILKRSRIIGTFLYSVILKVRF